MIVYDYNNGKIRGVAAIGSADAGLLQRVELARMDKVVNGTFRISFGSFAVLMAGAVSMIMLNLVE